VLASISGLVTRESVMGQARDLQHRLSALSACLTAPSEDEARLLVELEEHLAQSWLPDTPAELSPRELSIERATWYAAESLPAERRQRLERLAASADPARSPQYRVFRREAPLAAPILGVTVPAWGRGAAIDRTLGPFTSVDGRRFWFDFYRLARLIPMYLAGDSLPAILFYVPHRGPGDLLPIADAPALRHELAGSSFWIRADLLAPAAPAGGYIGLRIGGGQLELEARPMNVDGKLTLPVGARCRVHLALLTETAGGGPPGQAGVDAARAALVLPSAVSFELAAGHAAVVRLASASWTLYDQPIDFASTEAGAPAYEAALSSVVIPLAASAPQISVRDVRSPFAALDGEAAIQRAGWALPLAMIDIDSPTEASGAGGLAIQAGSALTLTWRGLRDGPIQLPAPWIVLSPGLIVVADLHASNRYANQRFRLWRDEDSRFRSELSLRYTASFPVFYAAAAAGSELVLAAASADARLDRPVDVAGTPFPARTTGSWLLLAHTDTARLVSFYEDSILLDSLAPDATWPVEPGQAVSLAIRNALFTITPINSVFLFGELRDEETVSRGTLLLGMGLYGLLPILPDPYAANITPAFRQLRTSRHRRQASLLLVAAVTWRKAATDDEPDDVATSFAFAPLGPHERAIAAWSSAAPRAQPPSRAPAVDCTTPRPARPGATSAPPLPWHQLSWTRYFGRFEVEQFALLDVSTNADQMGVSFAWFTVEDSGYVFYEMYRPRGPAAAPPPFPLAVRDLELSAQSRHVRAFTTPQVSWEPLFNVTAPPAPGVLDPPHGLNLFPDDGGPSRLFNDSVELVPIAPIPVTELLVQDFEQRAHGFTGALFTLPFGLRAFAELSRRDQVSGDQEPARLSFNRPEYADGALRGGLQLRVDAPTRPDASPSFRGSTLQLNNVLRPDGGPTFTGTLGQSVAQIFNNEFFFGGPTPGFKEIGVPLTRIDFCGYGASIFSHWENPHAAIAATSQAHFEVFLGRTAHEVIQARSLLYPWGVRVVRTIIIFRVSTAYVYRYDTGWQAESDGVYDFRYDVHAEIGGSRVLVSRPSPYEIHPGVVRGVFAVRNIRETTDVPAFGATWSKQSGESYVDDAGTLRTVEGAAGLTLEVALQPVYFDADVALEGVISGETGGRVPSRGMLGYVQLAPRGEPLPPHLFAALLDYQLGSLGGPVDCSIDVGWSGQKMRVSRVDVSSSQDTAGDPIFAGTARGAVVLPRDGSWSVVEHSQATGEVTPLDPQATVPLIRRGQLDPATQTTDAVPGDLFRLADPIDLLQAPPGAGTRNYGLLQTTGTQKALFRQPSFQLGRDVLLGARPDFADAYRMLGSTAIFPNVADALPLDLGELTTRIVDEGYRLLDSLGASRVLEQILPDQTLYLVNLPSLKIYVEYARKDTAGDPIDPGMLRFGFDAAAAEMGRRWLSKVNDIGMVVDLGPLERLMIIKGRFDAEKGAEPAFLQPEIELSDALQPIVDLLQILARLQGEDYAGALQKGLEIAMSNSAASWRYSFEARKEIPLVKFPPGLAYNDPNAPLKLECHLGLGVYFDAGLELPSAPGELVPSAGAFLEFGGRLSVMAVSVSVGTIYATGAVDLRIAADVKSGPSLFMKFGFGAEIVVGIPVVGNVSLLYMVSVEIGLTSESLSVGAALLFRGRAEILGGLVTVTIMIEAKGIVERALPPAPERTDMIAQVTFGLDISIFLVINISFSKSWQERRQIA
jgi:hypothetical protein